MVLKALAQWTRPWFPGAWRQPVTDQRFQPGSGHPWDCLHENSGAVGSVVHVEGEPTVDAGSSSSKSTHLHKDPDQNGAFEFPILK